MELFAGGARRLARSKRDKLAALIERNLGRWPADWRVRAEPRLSIDPEAVDDGILVQAWSPDTIKGRIEYLSAHFDFCRARGLPIDVTPGTVRDNLRHRQHRCASGELRIGGTSVYLSQVSGLACALWPDRAWTWLLTTRDRFKKLARLHPSRNDGRTVSIVELRLEALAEMEQADLAQARARTQRQRISVHTRARTALGMLLLSEAPTRIDSLAGVEIGRQLAPDLRTISLSAHETKEGASDQRCLSDRAVAALRGYISRHRSLVAPAGETMLFVADDGAPLSGDHLSRKIGDHCEKRFGRRSTAHPFRNAAVSYGGIEHCRRSAGGGRPCSAGYQPQARRPPTRTAGPRDRCSPERSYGPPPTRPLSSSVPARVFQAVARAFAAGGTRRARSTVPVGQKGHDRPQWVRVQLSPEPLRATSLACRNYLRKSSGGSFPARCRRFHVLPAPNRR